MSNPEKFDGVRVKVRAVFNYGFEWSELLCMECRSRGRTRFEFSSEMSERELRKVEKTIKGHGAVVGDFTGMFHNAPAVYSDGAYKFQFELQKANKLKVLIKEKDWKTLITNVGWCEASHPSK